jgi:hypothetical protein
MVRFFVYFYFCIKTMFSSSLPSVVCRSAHIFFTLFVFVAHSGVQHIFCCVFVSFVFVLCQYAEISVNYMGLGAAILIVNMQKSLLSLTRLRVAILYCQYSEICIYYEKNR